MNERKPMPLFVPLNILFILMLSGCTSLNPSASIRVEVDVYKGPLSKPISIQQAELAGIYADAKTATSQYTELLGQFQSYLDCHQEKLKASIKNAVCGSLGALMEQSRKLNEEFERGIAGDQLTQYPYSNKHLEALQKTARLAAQMKTQSATTAAAFIPMTSDHETLRVAQAMFSTMTSEYGNLISSRANALMIQLNGYKAIGKKAIDETVPGGVSRKNLHLNMYLADSSTTKTPRLYEWYDAKAPFLLEEWEYSIPGYNVSMTDRIRIYETLFDDTYWSNVNTVYASGTGDVGMALIRDDIGNWNLKNFDNDPAELLEAYKDVTLAGINATTKLIKSAASGGNVKVLQTALSMADQLTSPLDTTSSSNIPIAKWHRRVVEKIELIKVESMAKWGKMGCNGTPARAENPGSLGENPVVNGTLPQGLPAPAAPSPESGNVTATTNPVNGKPLAALLPEQRNVISGNPDCIQIVQETGEKIKNVLDIYSAELGVLQEIHIPPKPVKSSLQNNM